MVDLPELVNQLSNLTVLEAAELAKKLQARWDVQRKQRPVLSFNEGKVCDAVIRRLEEREQHKRTDMRWPDQENHKFPVEVAFMLGNKLYALEHTGIEPFDGHIRMEAQTERLFAPITNALKDSLGTDALFELYLPVNSLDGRKPAELQTIQQAIIEWVKATAPNIPKRPFPDFRGTLAGPVKLANVPFDLSLCRFEPPIVPGRYFQIKHTVDNIAKLRSDRMQAAIDKKFPKLAAWKKNNGAKSILVLEQNDIQLTNPSIVADAYLSLAQARLDRPAETYLVASCMSPN
jgi:ribosomal protein L7/L12